MIPLSPPNPADVTALMGGLAALLTAIAGILAVVLVQARQAKTAAEQAAHQLKNNSGKSVKDAIDSIRATVEKVDGKVDHVAETQRSQGYQIGEIKRDLADERAERRLDSEHIQAMDENARDEHKRLWRAISRKHN